jgi:hypothetical protein
MDRRQPKSFTGIVTTRGIAQRQLTSTDFQVLRGYLLLVFLRFLRSARAPLGLIYRICKFFLGRDMSRGDAEWGRKWDRILL